MGMFDTVNFKCPQCGETIEVQSKAGYCFLRTYNEDKVPAEIAKDLDCLVKECSNCNTELVLRTIMPIEDVSMHAVVRWGDDDYE